MGKSLIIKGADFSANALGNIGITNITSECEFSGVGRVYLHYPNAGQLDQFGYSASTLQTTRIGSLDVTQYRGRTIILRVWSVNKSSDFTGGAWWIAFASSVSVSLPWNGTGGVDKAITAVEHISGLGTGVYNTLTLQVPQTASYLIFRDRTDYPSTVYISND
jgi:hypothetical protein